MRQPAVLVKCRCHLARLSADLARSRPSPCVSLLVRLPFYLSRRIALRSTTYHRSLAHFHKASPMDRLRFRRSSRKESSATPPASSDGRSSGKTTPEPAVQGPPPLPQVPFKKPSPFRALHFSRSAKRARSPPPASLPHSPGAALHPHDAYERPPSSPLSLRKETQTPVEEPTHKDGKAPKIPSFLTLTSQGKLLMINLLALQLTCSLQR